MSSNSKTSISKSRYYLHRMVKKHRLDVRLVVQKRTIYVKHYNFVPALNDPYIKRLLDLGYSLQTEI